MEYIPESLGKKYEYDRDHHWMKWLEINAEIADKYCCRSCLCCSFEELIINLLYPQEGDTEALRAAEYDRNGFVPKGCRDRECARQGRATLLADHFYGERQALGCGNNADLSQFITDTEFHTCSGAILR